ncbi:MAG: relaxase/mobilization nuclease domain-containing protein [Clostridia bacterium]|nr:relaxase/mobilization nuclease domain-containing protein [Clostridia bacterium]
MHKQVVFITRLLNPNKTSTIARNKTYLSYICQKANVYRNEQTEHGLFGYIRDIPDIDKNNSISEVQKYIHKISNEKKNIYRSIISLSEEDAIEKGFDQKEAWSDLIKTKLPEFAKNLNIPYNNLEYVVSIHRDKGHPHAHIMFWDREQEIQRNFIHKKLSNNFRISLNKYIFNDEYTELLKQKDNIKESLIAEEKDIEKLLINELEGKNIDTTEQDFIYNGTMYMDRISKEEIKDIMEDVFELRKILPKTRKY